MGLNHGPNIVMDGLVLHLDAANVKSYPGSGTAWTDLSGKNNNGTLTNGPTYGNNSISFDGVDDYVNVPVAAGSSLKVTNSVTVSTWIYNRQWKESDFVEAGVTSIGDSGFVLWTTNIYYSKTNIAFGKQASDWATYIESVTDFSQKLNVWMNIVGTYDGSTTRLYYNGRLDNSKASTFSYNVTACTIGGGTSAYSDGYFNGNIACTKIYNRALSAEEVLQNFNALRGRYGV